MEKIAKPYEALFMLALGNIKKTLALAEAIPKDKIYPELLLGYMKSNNENVRNIAEMLIMRATQLNIDYIDLAKLAETNNEEMVRVILLLARKIEKHTLSLKALIIMSSSKFYNVRQFAYTLIIKNFGEEVELSLLIKCYAVDDVELSSGARDLASSRTEEISPIELFRLLDTKVEKVRNLVKELCLLYGSEDYNFGEIHKIAKKSDNIYATELAYLIILRKFSDKLDYEELDTIQYLNNADVRNLVPAILMERFQNMLNFEDYINFQTSPFLSVRSRAASLAYKYPIDLSFQDLLLRYANSDNEAIRSLSLTLLLKIPVEQLDYQLLIGWSSTQYKYSGKIAAALLRSIPTALLDPEVIAIFLNSDDDQILRIATELALSIPCDYSKEAHGFIKTYFN